MKIAAQINNSLNLGAEHSYYYKNGTWYHVLKQFPAVLIDSNGYVTFETEDVYLSTEGIKISPNTNQVHIPSGIASITGYQPFSDDEIALIRELELQRISSSPRKAAQEGETYDLFADDLALEGEDKDDETNTVQYDISSYGADYSVDGLVKRLKRGDIFTPDFQRDYVWNQSEASRLIESLLLGLPIPGVFLAKEPNTNKLFVIDGQQRLRSLQFFYEEFFNPKPTKGTKKIFKLVKVQKKFEGKTYSTLEESDRIKLDDSIVHATIVKQESPDEDNTSIYHVFERLNSGGKKLAPQEIRAAIYFGGLNELILELNNNPSWRELFGPVSVRLRDQEIILRILAVYFNYQNYTKPMVEFLNKFNKRHRNPTEDFKNISRNIFKNTHDFLLRTVGRTAFRPDRTVNIAVIEAVSVGTARLLNRNSSVDETAFIQAHRELLKDVAFLKTIQGGTSDETVFNERHALVEQYFSQL